MNQLYFLTCSIKDLAIAENAIQSLYKEVVDVSKGDYKEIGTGANKGTLSIAFLSLVSQENLRLRFQASSIHGVNYLLLQAEQSIAGYIEEDVLAWFSRHKKTLKISKPK